MDENLEQVLCLQWANNDRTCTYPIMVFTVIDGTALEFVSSNLGIDMRGVSLEAIQSIVFPIAPGNFLAISRPQFVRFVEDKTFIHSTREFLDAHRIAIEKQPDSELQKVAATIPDTPLWMITNTTDKDFMDEIRIRFAESPLATVLMAQLPIWEDTNFLTLALVLGSDLNLQLSAHAVATDKQTGIKQTLRTLPVALANMLRATSKGDRPIDQAAIRSVVTALKNT